MRLRRDWRWLAVLLTGLLLVVGASGRVWADKVYRWVDAEGRVSFSDQPPVAQTDQYRQPPRVVDVDGPPLQEHSADTKRRLDENRRWFEQRAKERQVEEAQRAREQAKQARADQKWQDQCNRAQQKLEQAERQYEVKRRTWLKPAAKSRLKEQLEARRVEVKHRCQM